MFDWVEQNAEIMFYYCDIVSRRLYPVGITRSPYSIDIASYQGYPTLYKHWLRDTIHGGRFTDTIVFAQLFWTHV